MGDLRFGSHSNCSPKAAGTASFGRLAWVGPGGPLWSLSRESGLQVAPGEHSACGKGADALVALQTRIHELGFSLPAFPLTQASQYGAAVVASAAEGLGHVDPYPVHAGIQIWPEIPLMLTHSAPAAQRCCPCTGRKAHRAGAGYTWGPHEDGELQSQLPPVPLQHHIPNWPHMCWQLAVQLHGSAGRGPGVGGGMGIGVPLATVG